MRLGQQSQFLRQSAIRSMTLECTRVGGINLAQGICDTPLPDPVRQAARAAIDEGVNIYTRFDGLPELRYAIANKLRAQGGLDYDPESEIVVTSGATGAFYTTCLALCDRGDEVILFEPYYGYHLDTLRLLGIVPRFVALPAPDFSFSRAAVAAQVTPRTRAIVVNTPANPSGKIFSREELMEIAIVAQSHDLVVITDEIYEHFVYDGASHLSPACLPGLRDRTVTINGFSKTFSITGWRIGFCASPHPIAERIGYLNDAIYVCAPAPLQRGVARGLELLEADFYASLGHEYQKKRDRLCDALAGAGLAPHRPQGAYYVLADISPLPGTSARERALYLLEETSIAAVPGSAFYQGTTGESLARFCFAKTDQELDRACENLSRWRPRS